MNTIKFLANKNGPDIVDPTDTGDSPAEANLFELHIDRVDIGNGQTAWTSSLKKVYNGEKHYFKDWSGLVAGLQDILTPRAQFRILQELMAQLSPENGCTRHTERNPN